MPKKSTNPASAASATTLTADAPTLTPAASTVLNLLDAQDATTATDLSERTGLGRSTVTKALAILHDSGLALRQEGGHDGARRVADRWLAASAAITAADAEVQAADDTHGVADPSASLNGTFDESPTNTDTATDDAAEEHTVPARSEAQAPDDDTTKDEPSADQPQEVAADAVTESHAETDAAEPEAAKTGGTGLGQAAGAKPEPVSDADDVATEPGDDVTDQAEADGEQGADTLSEVAGEDSDGTAADDDAPAAETKVSGPRLGKGELRAQVEAHLRANPNQSFTSTEIHHVLERSSGAIANACETLVEQEKVLVANERKPRRFKWNPAAA